MQNRIAALFVMSSAVVFVSTIIRRGVLFDEVGVDNHSERACRVFLAISVTGVRPC